MTQARFRGTLHAMQLIWFHRVLIGAAVIFFLGFAAWEVANYRNSGGSSALLLAAGSFAAAIGLGIYLARLKKILKL